jgi:hypothetical protein
MTPFENVAVAYFAALAVAGLGVDAPWRRRAPAIVLAVGVAAAVFATARLGGDGLRTWVPHAYLVAGYWIPGLLARRMTAVTAFERWLDGIDRTVRPRLPSVPDPAGPLVELAYLLCYPLVPASVLVIWMRGNAADVSRFWLAVLIAGYACYVTLPWLVSRPPRLTSMATPVGYLGAANVFVLRRVSHELNTFPSGHVAVSFAAAASLWTVSPGAALGVGAVAVAVATGAAAGRYHYVIDVWLGIAVAAGAVGISRAIE